MTNHVCTSHEQAAALLTGRCRERRKVANNTYLERRDDDIAVRLHDTDVVTYRVNGDVVLDSGGWRTSTTKERLSVYAPIRWVRQEKGVWYVGTGSFAQPGEEYRYDDGFTIHADGTVSGYPDEAEAVMADVEAEAVKRRIRKFVNGITPEDVVRAWENPQGDCWYCKFDLSTDCLADHIEEGYFHASLAYRAIKERGYPNPDLIMSLIYGDAQGGSIRNSFLKENLSKYLRKHLLTDRATR